jgi:hypothetical protein
MINLFKAFVAGEDFFYEGAFIAKVKYQRFKPEVESEAYKNKIIKNSKKLCIIECGGYEKEELVEKLTVYLMMNVEVKEIRKSEEVENQGVSWHTFSNKEISDFSHTTGDTNSIHLVENPVVQGLFILKELCDTTKADEIEAKYVYPVYGNNPVYLLREENKIKGFSNGVLCFQVSIIG